MIDETRVKLYKNFLENEHEMARAYGVAHLYYLKRVNENKAPFNMLPSVTTLSMCIRALDAYINGDDEVVLPSDKTFRAVTAFFKEAYQLNAVDAVNDRTLFEYSMSEILARQGQTELRQRQISPMPENWFTGKYYCYYEKYSAVKEASGAAYPVEINGGVLNVFELGDSSYEAAMITGFSDKENMDDAARKVFGHIAVSSGRLTAGDEEAIYSTFERYLESKTGSNRKIFLWRGNIKEKSNQNYASFKRWHTGSDYIDEQELMISLFKYPKTFYENCQGSAGMMVGITKDDISASKFLLSKNSLDWRTVSSFFERRSSRAAFTRQDDRDFLDIILALDD